MDDTLDPLSGSSHGVGQASCVVEAGSPAFLGGLGFACLSLNVKEQ